MIPDKLKKILLSKRNLREDNVGTIWIDEYFNEAIERLKIMNTEILVCNSLQRRCSCATIRDKKIIIVDNYLPELFIIFNQILCNENDSKYLELIFYKLMYEAYFLNGNIKLAAIYKTFMRKKFHEVGRMKIRQITKESKPQYLYIQQAFLVMHELMHSFFKDYPDSYRKQKETIKSVINTIFHDKKINYTQLVSDDYLEELCCDHLAAISAIAICIEYGHCSEIDAACAIILALHYQYLLLCIDKIVENNILTYEAREFAVRVVLIQCFVINYFKVNKPELVDNINNHMSDKINKWIKIYLNPLTAFFSNQRLTTIKYQNMEISNEDMERLQRELTKDFPNLHN